MIIYSEYPGTICSGLMIASEFQFSSVAQLSNCETMNCSTPGFLVHHQLPELCKLMSIESVMPSNCLRV